MTHQPSGKAASPAPSTTSIDLLVTDRSLIDCPGMDGSIPGQCIFACYNTTHRRPSTPQLQHIGSPLDALESALDSSNLAILRCLRSWALEESLPVYVVGGPVRDVLLGTSVKDLDFVVEGDGPQLARRLATELAGEVKTHDRFATSTLLRGQSRVDVATARKEVYPHPGALPLVSPGAIADDLARRDFSVNALALPLWESRSGLLDPHGGVDDIRRGLIRVLHPASFVDDPTRIFRALRYEGRFLFNIEEHTLSQLRDSVDRGRLSSLSSDRLRHELERILEEDRPELALDRATELGVLAAIHPSLGDSKTPTRVKAVAETDVTPGNAQTPIDRASIYIGALAYHLTPSQGEAVIHRLNMPNTWARVVRDVIALRDLEERVALPELRPSQVVSMAQGLAQEAVLTVSLLTDSPVAARRLKEYLDELRHVATVLKGNDLLALGVPPGPMVGRVLKALQEARLDGRVSNEEEERRLALELLVKEAERTKEGSGHG